MCESEICCKPDQESVFLPRLKKRALPGWDFDVQVLKSKENQKIIEENIFVLLYTHVLETLKRKRKIILIMIFQMIILLE